MTRNAQHFSFIGLVLMQYKAKKLPTHVHRARCLYDYDLH